MAAYYRAFGLTAIGQDSGNSSASFQASSRSILLLFIFAFYKGTILLLKDLRQAVSFQLLELISASRSVIRAATVLSN